MASDQTSKVDPGRLRSITNAPLEVRGGSGTALRFLRELAELTIDDAAVRLHARPAYLREVEAGMMSPSSYWVAHAAGVYADALLEKSQTSRLLRPTNVDERLRALDDVQ